MWAGMEDMASGAPCTSVHDCIYRSSWFWDSCHQAWIFLVLYQIVSLHFWLTIDVSFVSFFGLFQSFFPLTRMCSSKMVVFWVPWPTTCTFCWNFELRNWWYYGQYYMHLSLGSLCTLTHLVCLWLWCCHLRKLD